MSWSAYQKTNAVHQRGRGDGHSHRRYSVTAVRKDTVCHAAAALGDAKEAKGVAKEINIPGPFYCRTAYLEFFHEKSAKYWPLLSLSEIIVGD